MPPQASPKLSLTEQELEKIAKARSKSDSVKVDENWLFVAEFGYYFGWGGVEAVRENKITMEDATMLLAGARKVWSSRIYDHAAAALIGAGAAKSKKPSQTFKKATRELLNHAKADS